MAINIDDNSIMLMRANESLGQIHESFAATEYGIKLAEQVRFGLYQPEDVDNVRWRELLGADVNNLTHMPLTHGLAKVYIKYLGEAQPDYLSAKEAKQLEVTALIHDWAESIVGDISYSYKTDEDEIEEQAQFSSNLRNFYTGNDEEIVYLIHESVRGVIFEHESKLGRVFNSIESLGYLRTALRAFEHVRQQSAPDCHDHFRQLVADVLSNQTVKLINYSYEYAPVDIFLKSEANRINEAFKVADDSFSNFGPRATEKIEQFKKATLAWTLWSSAIGNDRLAS